MAKKQGFPYAKPQKISGVLPVPLGAFGGGGSGGSTADYDSYASSASFPVIGQADITYLAIDSGKLYYWNGSAYVEMSAGAAETLTSMGTLITSGASKATPVDSDEFAIRNSVGGLMAKVTWANIKATLLTTWKDVTGGLVGMTLYKINFKNAANTFTSYFTNSNTASKTYTFQDRDGTIADNTDLALKMALAGTETVTGEKTVSGVPLHLLRTGSDTESDIATLVASSAFVSEGAFVANRFYPLVGIRMTDNNATIINAGMYAQFTNNGSILYLGASNGYAGGIDKTLKLNFDGVVELLNGQLKFPATQNASSDANTLDDYEEGTCTLGMACSTSGTITITQTTVYTKTGRLVTVSSDIYVSSISSPLGNLNITGLPFAKGNGSRGCVSIVSRGGFDIVLLTEAMQMFANIENGATVANVFLMRNTSGARYDSLATNVQNGASFNLTISYEV